MRYTTKLLPSRSGNLGVLQLNNSKQLHALTIDMMHCFQDVLAEWYKDDSLAAILVKSSAPPEQEEDDDNSITNKKKKKTLAFCAGGDVKRVYTSGLQQQPQDGDGVVQHGIGYPGLDTAEFFRQEYQVNYQMATAKKPQISLWNGIVMGGGAGISVHGKYRIATENTLFAMPETAIGLFPDVGSMYWMPRLLSCASGQATYLALTGQRLEPADLLYTGLATHYVPSSKLPELEEALIQACSDENIGTDKTKNVVAPVLLSFHENPPVDPLKSTMADHRGTIQSVFGGVLSEQQPAKKRYGGVEQIIQALENHQGADSEFCQSTLETLHKMSPTSLKVTLEGLRRGAAAKSIADDLHMEFRMSQHFMRPGSDFYEGIRAMLIDKDNAPRWNPAKLEDVTSEMVESYFRPIEYEWKPLP